MTRFNIQEERIAASVMSRISRRRILQTRMRTSLYGFFLICAVGAVVPSVQYAATHAAASGFMDYVSLIISDGSRLSGSWGMLAMSIVESLPLAGIIFTLIALTAAAYCAQKLSMSRHTLSRSLSHSI